MNDTYTLTINNETPHNSPIVATFKKISFEQFRKDFDKATNNMYDIEQVRKYYDEIKLPKRSTASSAGYDFYCPTTFMVNVDKPTLIPTGICCEMRNDYVLMLHIRSSLGFKYGTTLRNGTGIIDADYINADNEGHIMAKLVTEEPLVINQGDRFMQGLFTQYGITVDDEAEGSRMGGFGSTGV